MTAVASQVLEVRIDILDWEPMHEIQAWNETALPVEEQVWNQVRQQIRIWDLKFHGREDRSVLEKVWKQVEDQRDFPEWITDTSLMSYRRLVELPVRWQTASQVSHPTWLQVRETMGKGMT